MRKNHKYRCNGNGTINWLQKYFEIDDFSTRYSFNEKTINLVWQYIYDDLNLDEYYESFPLLESIPNRSEMKKEDDESYRLYGCAPCDRFSMAVDEWLHKIKYIPMNYIIVESHRYYMKYNCGICNFCEFSFKYLFDYSKGKCYCCQFNKKI